MEVKRWHTLAALVCSLSLQAVALAQKPEVRTIIGTLVSDDVPKPTDEKSSDAVDKKPIKPQTRTRITTSDGGTLEATRITIQLPNGESRVISLPQAGGTLTADDVERRDVPEEYRMVPKYVIGVSLSEVPDSLRAHVTLPEGVGLMVGSLYPDSPAAKAGLLQYDLLLKCGEKDLQQPKDLQEIVDASEGKTVSLTLQRKGEMKTIEVTPIKREDAQFAMNENAEQSVKWLQTYNRQGDFTFVLPEGQFSPGGVNLASPVPLRAMISPPAATQQMEALTDAIRQLTEQVERLKGAIDKREEDQPENNRAKDEGDCWKLPRRDRLTTLISIS
jgi:PDZ domain